MDNPRFYSIVYYKKSRVPRVGNGGEKSSAGLLGPGVGCVPGAAEPPEAWEWEGEGTALKIIQV
jgi:hypothetical protein